MRKYILRFPALIFIAALLLSGVSFAELSMNERERESWEPYTFGDIAAARFAVYGLLPDEYRTPNPKTAAPLSRPDAVKFLRSAFGNKTDSHRKIPFIDVDDEYADAVSWAYSNGIAGGCSPNLFGNYSVTEQAFVTMLLNALGFRGQFVYADAFTFAQSVGLSRPLGISNSFSLGDAALYLQQALGMSAANGISARIKMNIPARMEDAPDRKQTTFPANMNLYPVSLEDAQKQIELATRYLAQSVTIYPDNQSADELFELYLRYVEDSKKGDAWYVNRILDERAVQPYLKTMDYELTDEQYRRFMQVMGALDEKWADGYLSKREYEQETAIARIQNHFSVIRSLTLSICYNEAWELACDADDAFTVYADDTLSRNADSFYRQYVADADSEKDAVFKAKNAVISNASYAHALRYADGCAVYPKNAHSVIGFFKDGKIVCDGYAQIFQYLMHRADVPCVTVFGSTVSKRQADNFATDHAWNKVFLDGKWLNMDLCWADTGWPTTFDLKDNDYYARYRHWLVTHTAL